MKDPTADFSRRVAYVIGLALLLSLFFGACARNAPPAVSLGGDTLEVGQPDRIVWTVKNENSADVTVKIQAKGNCGGRTYITAIRQVPSFTEQTDTIPRHRFGERTLCASVEAHAERAVVPPQLARFSAYGANAIYMTVANDLTHSSLWVR